MGGGSSGATIIRIEEWVTAAVQRGLCQKTAEAVPDRDRLYSRLELLHQLARESNFHRVSILIQDVEPGIRHLSRGALRDGDLLRHE